MSARTTRLSPGVYRAAKWISLLTSIATVVVFGTIGFNLSPVYYVGMAGAALPIAAYVFMRRRLRASEIGVRARSRWARPGSYVERPPAKDEKARRDKYLSWTAEQGDRPVDARTWTDLGMDDVTREIDVCFTDAGRNELYRLLHYPLVADSELAGRRSLADELLRDKGLREFVLGELSAVGEEKDADPSGFLWGSTIGRDKLAPLFLGMSLAAVMSVLSVFFVPLSTALLLVGAVFVVNMVLYYGKARHLSALVPSLRVLSRMLQGAAAIASHGLAGADTGALKNRAASRLRWSFRWLLAGSPGAVYSLSGDIFEVILLYLKIFFAIDLVCFDRISAVISRDVEAVREVYRSVGRLDAVHAIASYRAFRLRQCVPELVRGAGLEAERLYHPLVKKAVRNSVSIARPGAVITGTNMAGKSTFLRTLGVNAILAQTIGSCFAQSYRSDRFLVMSSIEKHDDLGSGKSFYYDEAERIFRMIVEVGGDAPVLLLIDELLSGTNSLERESASVAILHFLARKNALTVAATHDVTIAARVSSTYPPFYFTDKADENGLSFDYTLRPGIVQSRNAIKLLSLIGYPDDLIQEALKRARSEESPDAASDA